MLRTFLRLLAVTLLAVTIPVQGMASVVAAMCPAVTQHQDAAGGDHVQHGADGHDHAAHSHPGDSGAKQDDEGGKGSHCSAGASASIIGPVGPSILPSPSSSKYAFSQSPPHGVAPHGLYRPPLSV